MRKKPGIEPREVDLVVAPAEPLTPQAAEEIARFVAASKQKQKRPAVAGVARGPVMVFFCPADADYEMAQQLWRYRFLETNN